MCRHCSLSVNDDLKSVPVTAKELDVIETYLDQLLDLENLVKDCT
jgi:hypothetical protein